LARDSEAVRDIVCRAYGIARYARRVGYDEGAETLSRLRFGGSSGILEGFDGSEGARGFYTLRNAHLLHYRKREDKPTMEGIPESARIEEARAGLLRELVSDVSILEVP
jgi:protein-arginine kinase